MNHNCLLVGTCKCDITPKPPVALIGQYYGRIAEHIHSHLTATVLAAKYSEGAKTEQFVWVSCDLIGIPYRFLEQIRLEANKLDPDIDPDNIIVNATHIHTGPYIYSEAGGIFWGPDFDYTATVPNETDPDIYADWAASEIVVSIVEAIKRMEPVTAISGFDYLSTSYNRRVVFSDGHTEMYGSTARDDFMYLEGPSDSGIHFLAFVNTNDDIIAAMIDTPCPAQILEHHSFISADYWSYVRKNLEAEFGEKFALLSLCGAAGDLSPRDLVRTAMDEPKMHETKMYNVEGAVYLADKITEAFMKFVRSGGQKETAGVRHVSMVHMTSLYSVTEQDMMISKQKYDDLRKKYTSISEFTEQECTLLSIYAGCIKRFEVQQSTSKHPIEIHCLRIGNVKIATNPFELYVYYADRIRSKANQPNTFIVQLSCGYEGYLPSSVAVRNGGYSSYPCNGIIGPQGGEEIVRSTIEMLKSIE